MAGAALVAILAGGRGRRLGGAKPTTALGPLPLVAHPLAAAREAGLDAVVVAKPHTALPALECDVIYERSPGHHPLHGLIAALTAAGARSPDCACIALACDMPFVTGPVLGWLAQTGRDGASARGRLDALVTSAGGHLQPLLARYFPGHRHQLEAALRAGRSLTAAAESLSPQIADERELCRFGDPRRLCFSVDSEADLEVARRLL